MVKFSKQLEAQLIPEWRDAFVDYKKLKKHVKKIKISSSCLQRQSSSSSPSDQQALLLPNYGVSLLDPFRSLAARLFSSSSSSALQSDEENLYEVELVQSRDDEVKQFKDKLDDELKKVNDFFTAKETEFCERGDHINKQLQILVELKQVIEKNRGSRRRGLKNTSTVTTPADDSFSPRLSTLSSFSSESVNIGGCDDQEVTSLPTDLQGTNNNNNNTKLLDEVIAVLERNGVSFVGSGKMKLKKGTGGKLRVPSLRIDIPATTPVKTVLRIWEDFVNGFLKEGPAAGGSVDYLNRKKLQYAAKIIRTAYTELYRGLGLLKTYSSLNMVAFRKILKKFDKAMNQKQASADFFRKVRASHFISSDKVVKMEDEVESNFTKHFACNDRKQAMKVLSPRQSKESHMITFLVGLFTGSFVTLFGVYAILAHLLGIFSSSDDYTYMETVYPVFSMIALLSLHIFLYGCNLFAWQGTRINHNFIFDFNENTALKHRDAFLICASFMTVVVGALVAQLLLKSVGLASLPADAIPGILLLLFTGILLCPFNIFYRSTRLCLLRVIRNIVFSPFYKVLMVDFFMADQLTSQIPLLRHLEFTACYFMAGGFKTHSVQTCTLSKQYKLLAYIISFLPYYWRAMQCLRRYIEEGYDINHLKNAGKYMSAMLAAAARFKYALEPTPLWLAVVIITSTGATIYQLYWDYVMDWGLMKLSSRNLFLRNELILKNKSIYYISLVVNFVLRLAWIESVMHLNLGKVEHRFLDFLLASFEVIRRGHWNFYRIENEHLNNVGKFRAVKNVPLPFREEADE